MLVWIANRANNSMLTDPAFTPYLFDAANGWPIDTANPGVDLRQRAAFDHFKQRLQEGYVNLGVRGYKIDRGEQGEYPAALENELGVLMTRMARESVEEVFPGDGFVFGRNAHDTSRRYVAVWNGDSDANASGLADSVKQVIRAGVMNFSMAGSDTGGYSGTPDKETFARWLQFSTYVPMMEVLLGPNRTIWTNYDQQLIDTRLGADPVPGGLPDPRSRRPLRLLHRQRRAPDHLFDDPRGSHPPALRRPGCRWCGAGLRRPLSRVTRNGVRLALGDGFRFDPDARRLTIPFSGATDIQIT